MASFRWLALISVLTAAPTLSAQAIRVTPRVALLDDAVRIGATGLKPDVTAVFRARRADSQGRVWESALEVGSPGTELEFAL